MPHQTPVIRRVDALRSYVSEWRQAGKSVALVPTMGALHEGHLSLVKLAKRKADRTVVSIYVNPKQFSINEDLSRYPRDEAGDHTKLAMVGTDLVWAPTNSEIYPEGFSTHVIPNGCALPLEGEFRPEHFSGVATVCSKLFLIVQPDLAIFGKKDFQQLCVIRQLVRDLNFPLKILAADISRDKDGLARSSRNVYLSTRERKIAPGLYQTINEVAISIKKGTPVNKAIGRGKMTLLKLGFKKVDYLAVCDSETLQPYSAENKKSGRVLAAVWLGKTRLIDNVSL